MNGADTQLWRGWRTDRDEQAFEALVTPHLAFAFDFARRLGAHPDQADDVVQEALVTLARETSDRPVRVGIRAWLGRSVALGVKMLRRSEGRRERRERAYERPVPSPRSVAPALDVERAIARLPDGQREAVVLRYRHDLEYSAIAEVLGISENAARLRVHKAMGELRVKLGRNAGPMVAVLPLLDGTGRTNVLLAALQTPATSALPLVVGALAMKHALIAVAVLAAIGLVVGISLSETDTPTTITDPVEEPPVVAEVDEPVTTPDLTPAPIVQSEPETPVARPEPVATTTVEQLLAQGASIAFVTGDQLTGTRHRIQWLKEGDPIPVGRPSAIQLNEADLDLLLADEGLMHALLYLDVVADRFQDRDLEIIARHADLRALRMSRTNVTDLGMESLREMPSLAMLEIRSTRVGDAGMETVGALPNLVWLDVRDTHISDTGMKHLRGLENLKKFEFGGTRVTDDGLGQLRKAKLVELNLDGTRISGRGVRHLDLSELEVLEADEVGSINDDLLRGLAKADKLKELVLKETAVTDDGIRRLSKCEALEELDLNDTQVTVESLKYLRYLPNLKDLSLRQTSVGDEIIEFLIQYPALEEVNLSDTRVTAAGVARLRDARPELDVREP